MVSVWARPSEIGVVSTPASSALREPASLPIVTDGSRGRETVLVQAALLALAGLGPITAAPDRDTQVQQIQFRGREGECPDGYDFNYSNGRCYPNGYHAPGAYARPRYVPQPYGYGDGYYRRQRDWYGPRYYERY